MTFGKPNESEQRIPYEGKQFGPGMVRDRPREAMGEGDSRNEQFGMAENLSNGFNKSNFKSMTMEHNYEMASPAQDAKF
jgi:hypothetical protein